VYKCRTFLGPWGFRELFFRLPMMEKQSERLAQEDSDSFEKRQKGETIGATWVVKLRAHNGSNG